MSVVNNSAYGTRNPIFGVQQKPIVSPRDPNTRDNAQIGTIWINKLTNDFFVLTSITAGVANWATPSNGSGIFTSLEATTGNITADLGNIVATVGNVTAGGSMSAGTTITAGTGLTVTTGDLAVNTGNIDVVGGTITADGNIITETGNFVAQDGGVSVTNTGNNTTAPEVQFSKNRAGGAVHNADGLGGLTFFGFDGAALQPGASIDVVTNGTIGAGQMPSALVLSTAPDAVGAPIPRLTITSDGNVEISTPDSGPELILGTVPVSVGAGAPAINPSVVGQLYINTTAVTAATRLYIATDTVGTFTNITCAA